MTVKEINGRLTCTRCGYEWSAMLSDDEWPDHCDCETDVTEAEDVVEFEYDGLSLSLSLPLNEVTP